MVLAFGNRPRDLLLLRLLFTVVHRAHQEIDCVITRVCIVEYEILLAHLVRTELVTNYTRPKNAIMRKKE